METFMSQIRNHEDLLIWSCASLRCDDNTPKLPAARLEDSARALDRLYRRRQFPLDEQSRLEPPMNKRVRRTPGECRGVPPTLRFPHV